MTVSRPDNETIFHAARAILDPDRRREYVREACNGDEARIALVESLLAAADRPDSLLDRPAAGTPAETIDQRATERPGTTIGPYKLIEQIGEGGMGTVWMAQQTLPVKRLVALKLIKAGMDSKQVIARFEAERQALALMDHANIARVLDAGATGAGRPYFVMDLVKGTPITRYCDEHHLTPRQRLELFVPVCQAVQHAHQKGIIHRDLKPSNVLVALYDGKPVPKVIDFGVAKAAGQQLTERTLVTGFGDIVGTLEYMSPEQAEINQLDIDTRSDIYSLGVLLYELLAGSPPFTRQELERAGMLEMLRVIREQEPSRPSTKLSTAEGLPTLAANRGTEPAKLTKLVRGELDWIVMKALEKDRSRRYETANGFAMDVQRYLADEPVVAGPPSAAYRLRKFARRNRVQLLVAALVGLVLLVGTGSIGWALWDRAQQRALNQAEKNFQAQKNRDHFQAVLEGLPDLHRRFLWQEAEAQLDRAQTLVDGDGEPELLERIAGARRKTQLLHGLDEARLIQSMWIEGHFNYAGAAAAYETAFDTYGLQVQPGQTEDLGRRICAEEPLVREALIVALDDWWHCRQVGHSAVRAEVRDLAVAADDDPWRQEVRSADAAKDGAALARLADDAHWLLPQAISLDLLSNLLRDFDRRDEAVALLRWARGQYPTDFWIALGLGSVLETQGASPADLEERIGCCRVAVALRPDAYAARVNLGIALHKKQQLDDAIAEFKKAIELDPKFAEAHNNLGLALRDKKQLDAAIVEYRKAIELDPEYSNAHHGLGLILYDKREFDDASAEYRKAIDLDPKNARAHNSLGNALCDKRELDDGIAEYRKAIDIDPNYASAHNNLGNALCDKRELDDAIAEYRKAIELDPKYALPHNGLGVALRGKKQLDDAIAEYRKALDLDPKYATAHYTLGNALKAKREFEDAIAEYREAIDLDPNYAESYCNLGDALMQQGRFADALDHLKRGHALGSRRGAAWQYPSAQWVENCERLVTLEARLPAVLKGEDHVANTAEIQGFAELCGLQKRYAAAGKLWGDAFATNPKLADDMKLQNRYNAACFAALAAAGAGIDADQLDENERARLRRQALEWLRADLAYWQSEATSGKESGLALVRAILTHWQEDPDLAGLRDQDDLAKLSADERQACQELWTDVAVLLMQTADAK
jgi:serine/threonine protein kinase/Tfp pilus assembly protein PilF